MRYFLHIAYKGNTFRGWQMQTSAISVQEVMEKKLSEYFKTKTAVIGCGRTDAMVHASQYFAHIDVENALHPDTLFRLNKCLPSTISIFDIIAVSPQDHARFSATKRTYNYFVHTYDDALLNDQSALYIIDNLQIDKMNKAMQLLTQYNNYYSYCKTPNQHNTTLCQLSEANMYVNEAKNRLRFEIKADRFLRGMIRILIAQILEIGKGNLQLSNFEKLLQTPQTPNFKTLAHPQGLYLSKIEYAFLDLSPKNNIVEILGFGLHKIENTN